MTLYQFLSFVFGIVVILVGQVVLWTRFKTLVEKDMAQCKKDIKKHETCITNVKRDMGKLITEPQHEKMQTDCQRGIYNDINNITRSIDELRSEVRSNNENFRQVSIELAGLRSDLQHLKVVK